MNAHLAVEIVNPEAGCPVLLACDHASNRVPEELAGLGLDERELSRHIAWDIGAGIVARRMAAGLNATAVLGGVSRLVVDLNRDPDDPDLIPASSDGTPVPANQSLHEDERRRRLDAYFHPYHDAIDAQTGRLLSLGLQPVLVAIHSFTPVMKGFVRPWQVGVLWNQDGRLAQPLIGQLEAAGFRTGDNQPYSGRDLAYTMNRHAGAKGLLHAGIEIRQDLIRSVKEANDWGDRLARLLLKLGAA